MSSLSNRPLKALALFVEAGVFALFAVAGRGLLPRRCSQLPGAAQA